MGQSDPQGIRGKAGFRGVVCAAVAASRDEICAGSLQRSWLGDLLCSAQQSDGVKSRRNPTLRQTAGLQAASRSLEYTGQRREKIGDFGKVLLYSPCLAPSPAMRQAEASRK